MIQYRPNLATILTLLTLLAVAGLGLTLILGVPGAQAQSAPGAPANLTLTRANGTVTATWDAPGGATKYHVTYSSNNRQSWSLAAAEHPTNSITITGADNSKTYIVAVRAGNDHGWSGWANSAPAGPYTPQPPGAPTNLTLARANGTVTATWDAPSGATKYHVTYSSDNKQSWSLAAGEHPTASITITGADNSKSYIVAVRAGNADGWSGWVTSAPAGPYTPQPPATPASVTLTRDDGTVTASWDAPSGATKYHVTYSSDNKQSWSSAAGEHPTASITITGADNDKSYVVAVRAGNADGWSGWRDSSSIGPYKLVSVSNLDNNPHQWCPVTGNTKCVIGFTTGSKTNGYTLTELTSKFTPTQNPNDKLGDIVVTLHATTKLSTESDRLIPASPALATLSGSNPNPDTLTEYTYTCSGAGCALSPDTNYFVQFTATAGVNGKERYWMLTTLSDDQVLVPSDNGWSLDGDLYLYARDSWIFYWDAGFLKVSALEK